MVDRWNIGFQKDNSHFNFIVNPAGGGAINPTLHYPRAHHSTIPLFHHSNCERSELTCFLTCLFNFAGTYITVNPYVNLRPNFAVRFENNGVVITAGVCFLVHNIELINRGVGFFGFFQLVFDVFAVLRTQIEDLERIFFFGNNGFWDDAMLD